VLIHVLTQKGKGYAPAENNPAKFHGVGKFDPATGESLKAKNPSFSDAFGEAMVELARENDRLCAITAAMPDGTGLLPFAQEYPNRTFDVGIAEEHAVSMAGGLAKQGMVPVVAIYSTFLQRSFDQILQDIAMLKLHVVLAVDRAGLVGEDGETHHGVFDTGYLPLAPGMTVLCPASRAELKDMLRWAVNEYDGPVAIRYPRGGDGEYTQSVFDPTKCVDVLRGGKDCAIVTYGTLVNQALKSAQLLAQKGVEAAVISLKAIAPLPVDALVDALGGIRHLIVAEEAFSQAAIADTLSCRLRQTGENYRVDSLDLGSHYVPHGDMASLYKHYGLDGASIADFILEVRKIED
jgi:1-deoxy-D-xylulose-5-phosphate synthase